MKKSLLIILLIIVSLTFTLTACEELPDQTHRHVYSEDWSFDDDYHFHKAVCEHTDEVDGKAKHQFKPVLEGNVEKCDVCGYVRNASVPQPEPHKHVYSEEISFNETHHWYSAICEHTNEVKDYAPHSYVDGICSVCGQWSSASDVLFSVVSRSDVWNYALTLNNVVLNVAELWTNGDQQSGEVTVNGELKLSLSDKGKLSGYGCIEAGDQAYKAVIEDNTLYACGNGAYLKTDVNELLLQQGVDVSAILDEINANTQQIREYVEQARDILNGLPVQGDAIDVLLGSVLRLDEGNSTDELTAYAVDYGVLRQLNNTLASVTVSDYVNEVLSKLDGTSLGLLLGSNVNELPDNIRVLLTNSIGKTLLTLSANGYSLDDLLSDLNKLIEQYYPDSSVNNVDELANAIIKQYYPDDEVNTLQELIEAIGDNLPFKINANGVTVKSLILATSMLSPETLWNSIQQDDASKISSAEVAESLTELLLIYGDKTVYQLIELNANGVTAEYIESLADGAVDLLEDCLAIRLYVDSDGVLRKLVISVESADTAYDQPEIEQLRQLLTAVKGAIVLNRDYRSSCDYSEVIEQVNAYYGSLQG